MLWVTNSKDHAVCARGFDLQTPYIQMVSQITLTSNDERTVKNCNPFTQQIINEHYNYSLEFFNSSTFQNGQTYFKNLAANPAKFLVYLTILGRYALKD